MSTTGVRKRNWAYVLSMLFCGCLVAAPGLYYLLHSDHIHPAVNTQNVQPTARLERRVDTNPVDRAEIALNLADKSLAKVWPQMVQDCALRYSDDATAVALRDYIIRSDADAASSPNHFRDLIISKIRLIRFLGFMNNDVADQFVNELFDFDTAKLLLADWKGSPVPSPFASHDELIQTAQANAAKALAISQRSSNLDRVQSAYNELKVKPGVVGSIFFDGLIDAVAIDLFIKEHSREELASILGTEDEIDSLSPYIHRLINN